MTIDVKNCTAADAKRFNAQSRGDRSTGFVSCLGCKGWPDVHLWRSKRKSDRRITVRCPQCDVDPNRTIVGDSIDGIRAAWNERHKRHQLT